MSCHIFGITSGITILGSKYLGKINMEKKMKKGIIIVISSLVLVTLAVLLWSNSLPSNKNAYESNIKNESSEHLQKSDNFTSNDSEEVNTKQVNASITDYSTLYAPENQIINNEKHYKICIDPGHYLGSSTLEGTNMYGYEEGAFTLQLALQLKEQLEKYGIEAYLTRETDSITILNYTDDDLDDGPIRLRGEYSKGADLFVSIHTNGNSDNANGYPTCNQPIQINKTIVFVNKIAAQSDTYIGVANEIGQAVTNISYEMGLLENNDFCIVDKDSLKEWTESFNDSLNEPGTVCYRLGKSGDYYGVLRGATNVGSPGLIIEHGYHTVEEVRNLAMNDNLAKRWAQADAYGIAKGLGIIE